VKFVPSNDRERDFVVVFGRAKLVVLFLVRSDALQKWWFFQALSEAIFFVAIFVGHVSISGDRAFRLRLLPRNPLPRLSTTGAAPFACASNCAATAPFGIDRGGTIAQETILHSTPTQGNINFGFPGAEGGDVPWAANHTLSDSAGSAISLVSRREQIERPEIQYNPQIMLTIASLLGLMLSATRNRSFVPLIAVTSWSPETFETRCGLSDG
jgi:hypothetical protein